MSEDALAGLLDSFGALNIDSCTPQTNRTVLGQLDSNIQPPSLSKDNKAPVKGNTSPTETENLPLASTQHLVGSLSPPATASADSPTVSCEEETAPGDQVSEINRKFASEPTAELVEPTSGLKVSTEQPTETADKSETTTEGSIEVTESAKATEGSLEVAELAKVTESLAEVTTASAKVTESSAEVTEPERVTKGSVEITESAEVTESSVEVAVPAEVTESSAEATESGKVTESSTEVTESAKVTEVSTEVTESAKVTQGSVEPAQASRESDQFSTIRELDEQERWCDRNTVITSLDHQENRDLVAGILHSLIDELPVSNETLVVAPAEEDNSSRAEDLNSIIPQLPSVAVPADAFDFDPLASAVADIEQKVDTPQQVAVEQTPVESSDNGALLPFSPLAAVSGEAVGRIPNLLDETFEVKPASSLNQTFDKAADVSVFEEGDSELENQSSHLNTTVNLGPKSDNLNGTFVCESSATVESETTRVLNTTFDTVSNTVLESDVTISKPSDCTTVVEQPIESVETTTEPISAAETYQQLESANSTSGEQLTAGESPTKQSAVECSSSAQQTTTATEPVPTESVPTESVPTDAAPVENKQPISDTNNLGGQEPITTQETSSSELSSTTKSTAEPSKMSEEDDVPLPRGAYTINWDEIDEFADPFAMSKPKGSKPMMANSPPIKSNASPPKFSPEKEPEPVVETAPVAEVPQAVVQETVDKPTGAEATTEAKDSNGTAEKDEGPVEPVKKKSPVKKKKTTGKGGSKFADFKRKQAAKQKSSGGEGDGPDLTLSIPLPAVDTPPAEDEAPVPPPAAYDFENCDDPFGSKKSKMAASPPIRVKPAVEVDYDKIDNPFGTSSKMANSPVKAEPPTAFADPEQMEDPFKPKKTLAVSPTTNLSASPFMSSAELSSPATLKEEARESPARDQFSSATNGSQDDEFEDAVDELPQDEFRPAAPEMFNTTADLGVLDRAANMKPTFRESALSRQSLYQRFDPLMDKAASPPAPADAVEKSLCLIGEEVVTPTEPVDHVDKLLDITMTSPSESRAPPKFSQDEMDEKDETIRELRLTIEALKLENAKKVGELEQKLEKAEASSAEYERTVGSLLDEREAAMEKASNVSEDMLAEVKGDRDRYAEDLAFVESSFSDLHKRYDNQRDLIAEIKKNESSLRQKLSEEKRAVSEAVNKFTSLKTEYEQKLQTAFTQIEQLKTSNQADLAKMELAKRKAELAVDGLTQQVAQKTTENEELTRICENLIQLKGSGGS